MVDADDTLERDAACEACDTPLGGRRLLQVDGPDLRNFCSESCLRVARSAQRKQRWKSRRRGMKVVIIGSAVAGACLAPHEVKFSQRLQPAVRATVASSKGAAGPPVPETPPGWFGPEWPPTDTNVLAALGRDAWLHPLAGPIRRMPRADSRVFGAVRPGDRAPECRNGHCGVDLGGEIWGEHVRAVHDGVVDAVKRGVNPDRGGEFVRIAHRNGTVFTWYFHLAAIPRRIERGTFVKSGDLIGLVGDTGVKESAPHLHFAVTIRPSPDKPLERYIDPEPLIALWPLRVPINDGAAGLVTTLAEPGLPLGSANAIPGRRRMLELRRNKAAAATRGSTGESGGPAPSSAEEAPAAESSSSESTGDE
jgi:murein DD-endopeptidase MepM/ murein hydrolase activator NlpD